MDNEALVDQVTRIIMERLGVAKPGCPTNPVITTFGDVPDCVLGTGATVRRGSGPADADGADFIVLSQAAFRAFHGGVIPAGLVRVAIPTSAPSAPAAGCTECASGPATYDISGKRTVTENDIRHMELHAGVTVKVAPKAIVTALARDRIVGQGAEIVR